MQIHYSSKVASFAILVDFDEQHTSRRSSVEGSRLRLAFFLCLFDVDTGVEVGVSISILKLLIIPNQSLCPI